MLHNNRELKTMHFCLSCVTGCRH